VATDQTWKNMAAAKMQNALKLDKSETCASNRGCQSQCATKFLWPDKNWIKG
jgi:hypothetical protein